MITRPRSGRSEPCPRGHDHLRPCSAAWPSGVARAWLLLGWWPRITSSARRSRPPFRRRAARHGRRVQPRIACTPAAAPSTRSRRYASPIGSPRNPRIRPPLRITRRLPYVVQVLSEEIWTHQQTIDLSREQRSPSLRCSTLSPLGRTKRFRTDGRGRNSAGLRRSRSRRVRAHT